MSDQPSMQIETSAHGAMRSPFGRELPLMRWTVGAIFVALIGSWLVWWGLHLQRQFAEDEIRAACQRVMPDAVQRCVDTVVIQRGGARR